MPNLELLKSTITKAGITKNALADKCGFTRQTLDNKLEGKSEFKASEIMLVSLALHLNVTERDAIFFGG